MKNFYNKNTKNVKYVDTQNIVKYPVNKVNLVEKETLNKFRSNIAQDLINNIDYLKAKFVDLKSVSLNNNYIYMQGNSLQFYRIIYSHNLIYNL